MLKKIKKTGRKPEGRVTPPSRTSSEKIPNRSLANNTLVHVACLVVLVLAVYSNTLNAPFQLDEEFHLVGNPLVKDFRYFVHPSDGRWAVMQYNLFVNRYVAFLTFALNYRVHGFSVVGYHIVNIVVHVANSILVYLLVLLSFRTPFLVNSLLKRQSQYVALFSSALFAVHPLQTEAVTYVMQRFASLVAFFYLLSLVAYIQSRLLGGADSPSPLPRKEGARGRVSSGARFIFYAISLLSAILAMKTKENAFTLPLIIALYEFCFFSPSPRVSLSPRIRAPISPRLLYLVPLLLTLLVIPLTHMSEGGSPQLDPGLYCRNTSKSEYLFTQFRVLITYLRLLFLPVNQSLYYDYPLFESFFDPRVMLSFLFLSLLFGSGIYLFWKGGKPVKPGSNGNEEFTAPDPGPLRFVGFGILWFFITISVESSVIPLWLLICEYRAYLPSVGVSICVVTGAFMIRGRMRSLRAGQIILVLLVLATGALSVATFLRNEVWGDRIRLWEDTVKKSPQNPDPHIKLGTVYQASNMPAKAVEQFLIAISLRPDYAGTHSEMGLIYYRMGQMDKALKELTTALSINDNL
jgi:hypothetical protein